MFTKVKIGEMARLNDLSVQTLRYYEEVGLLKPVSVDPDTGYRYYDIQQSAQLDIIQLLKALNFSLAEIRQLAQRDYQDLDPQLAAKEHELVVEQQSVQYRLSLIRSLQRGEQQFQRIQQATALEFREFPQRRLHTFDIQRNIYQMTLSEYEYHLRLFKQHLNHLGAPFVFNCVGSLLQREYFEAGHWDSRRLCILLPKRDKTDLHNYTLPAGIYAVSYCDDFSKEVSALEQLREALLAARYRIAGDYICEVIYELPKEAQAPRQMLIRMQVPVARE